MIGGYDDDLGLAFPSMDVHRELLSSGYSFFGRRDGGEDMYTRRGGEPGGVYDVALVSAPRDGAVLVRYVEASADEVSRIFDGGTGGRG